MDNVCLVVIHSAHVYFNIITVRICCLVLLLALMLVLKLCVEVLILFCMVVNRLYTLLHWAYSIGRFVEHHYCTGGRGLVFNGTFPVEYGGPLMPT